MATSIGVVAIEILRGNTMPQSQRVEAWFVPGQTGTGAQRMGLNQSAFDYRAVLYGTQANVEARLVALAALQGFVVSIEDDHAEIRPNCLVMSVGVPDRKRVILDGVTSLRATVSVRGVRTA